MKPKRDFSQFLKDRLLSDKYGNWHKLDSKFLQKLCDRIADEIEEFLSEDPHTECNAEINDLVSALTAQEGFSRIRL